MIVQRLIFQKHLEDGERVLFAVHRHWVAVLFPFFQVAAFGFAAPWGLYLIGFSAPAFFWLAVGWSLLAYFRLVYVFLDWYGDAWLVTDSSIVSVGWKGLFSNTASRIGFEDVEGVSYVIDGFWPTVLGYGEVTLKSVSGNILRLARASNPKKIELSIMRHHQGFLKNKEMKDSDGLRQLLSQMVLTQLRRDSK